MAATVTDSDLRARFPRSFGYVASVRKRAVQLARTPGDDASIALGASKVFGRPDLPSGAQWPSRSDRPMSFLAQLRLDELAAHDEDALVPHDGLVLFFFDEAGSTGAATRVDADAGKLRRLAPPSGGEPAIERAAASVAMNEVASFPAPPSPFVDLDAIHKTERAAYEALVREVSSVGDKVFGYPEPGDVDERSDGDTRLLLQLAVDRGRIYFYGQDADLRRGDFGRVRAVRVTGG